MRTLVAEHLSETTTPEQQHPGVVDLLQQILEQAASCGPDTPVSAEGQSIVLDIELNESRYLLVRMPAAMSRTLRTLSPRELEIARMVARGYPNKIIADVLEISSWTVCTHLRRVFAKFGVTSRAAMVARLLEHDVLREHCAK